MTIAEQQTSPITPDSNAWKELIAQGEEQGYITYDDILARIPTLEHNIELLEELLDALHNAGVEVLPTSPAKEVSGDGTRAEEAEELLDPSALYEDLIKDAGYQQALDTDDVVGRAVRPNAASRNARHG
jgi:RNA polymerase primary sigma factor